MHFTQQPSTPWLKMAVKRGRLKTGQTIPSLRAEWSPVQAPQLQEKLPAYKKICGFGEVDVPLAFPMVFASSLQAQLLVNKGFPLPVLGLVHVGQRMRWHCDRDHRVALFQADGQKQTQQVNHQLLVTLASQRQVKRGVVFTLRTTLASDSQMVWEAETDILSMAAQGHGKNDSKSMPEETPVAVTQTWSLAADLGRRYAKVAGDFNPIHLYAWSAKLFGFKKAIVHGMWTLAHALAQYETIIRSSEEASNKYVENVEAHFVRPVFIPSEPTFELSVNGAQAQLQVYQQRSGSTEQKLAMWAVINR